MKRLLLAGAAIAALAALTWAQPVVPTSWTGNETITASIGGPGGSGVFITTAQLRNACNIGLQTAATGTVQANNLACANVFTAALSGTVTFNTPTNPYDGEYIMVVNGTNSAFTQTITFAPSAGQSLVPTASGAIATLAAGTSALFQYNLANTTWYRIR